MVTAADALARFSELVRTCPTIAPARHMSQMVEAIKLYVATSQRAGVPPTPKLHLALHLVERTASPKTQKMHNVLAFPAVSQTSKR